MGWVGAKHKTSAPIARSLLAPRGLSLIRESPKHTNLQQRDTSGCTESAPIIQTLALTQLWDRGWGVVGCVGGGVPPRSCCGGGWVGWCVLAWEGVWLTASSREGVWLKHKQSSQTANCSLGTFPKLVRKRYRAATCSLGT